METVNNNTLAIWDAPDKQHKAKLQLLDTEESSEAHMAIVDMNVCCAIRPAIEGRLHNVVEGESFRRVYKAAYTGFKASVVQLIS